MPLTVALSAPAFDFESVLSAVAGIAGLLAASAALFSATRERQGAKDAVKRIHKVAPDAAISSLDLSQLGSYIYATLGEIPITEYASNSDARRDLARALDQIERFVSADESVPVEGGNTPQAAQQWLVAAQQALSTNDIWQALARLRRSIEIDLQLLALQHDVLVPPHAGAGRLLNSLRRGDVIPPDVAQDLRRAIDTANRAIHGEEVSAADAEEALSQASRALRFLQHRTG